ncbi:MAG TPA: hypothetical protein VFA00_02035 [Actinomycetota bacterium]|jgi:hypothetical protein|nr:hypothetical protein [Actinomycetota bacterium]
MRLLALIYIVIGVLVAAARNYFERLDSVRGIVSLLIAILVWPVVVFDIDVRIGRDGNGKNGSLLLPFGLMWSMARDQALQKMFRWQSTPK